MKFHTENETETFDFHEAYVEELRFGAGVFYMLLDNVKILETNSCNRDVRTMREWSGASHSGCTGEQCHRGRL